MGVVNTSVTKLYLRRLNIEIAHYTSLEVKIPLCTDTKT